MDLSHLKNSELEPQFQKYTQELTQYQGSPASQMTAAEVMDVVARLPDCDGQAADAISAYTLV